MCGHVKQQEVLFLRGQDAFLHQVLREALPDVSQLVVQLQGIPGLSWKTGGGLGHEGHLPKRCSNHSDRRGVSPLSSSIQLWTVSGGWVSFMCFKASSSSTSPVGASDLQITFANKRNQFELGKLPSKLMAHPA